MKILSWILSSFISIVHLWVFILPHYSRCGSTRDFGLSVDFTWVGSLGFFKCQWMKRFSSSDFITHASKRRVMLVDGLLGRFFTSSQFRSYSSSLSLIFGVKDSLATSRSLSSWAHVCWVCWLQSSWISDFQSISSVFSAIGFHHLCCSFLTLGAYIW